MQNWRINIVFLLLFLLGAATIGRLVFIQIIDHGFYKAMAQGQQNISSFVKGERGDIFVQDKDGNLYTIATNYSVPFIFLSPPEIEDANATAAGIASVLNISEEFILERMGKPDSLFEVLKKNISDKEELEIKALELPGIYVGKETTRLYPQKEFASHVIGFTNQDDIGQYGIEEQYNDVLEGEEGLVISATNVGGYLFLSNKTPKDGADIILTLDYNIQLQAEKILKDTARALKVKEGSIIVLDPNTGKILALANIPAFDPNSYGNVRGLDVFQNATLEKLFEPGSVFKPITLASAIDTGKLTPDTTYIDTGSVTIGIYTITNYNERVFGERTMSEVLQFSINTGAVFAESELGHSDFIKYIERFGLFKPTKIDLVGEIYSQNKELKKGYEINYATASFGQGIEMTPMQLIRAFGGIANNGLMHTPYIVEDVKDTTGIPFERSETQSTRAISKRTSSQITSMLVSVTEDGFGKAARIPGYYVAGKTGTAQVSNSALGIAKSGYSDETVQSFIGYVPAFNPRFLVLVKLNNPQTKTAEYSAVPIFKELASYIIDYYQIPPDYTP